MSNFDLEKGGIQLNKSSLVKLCLDVSMLQHMYCSFCFVTFVNIFLEKIIFVYFTKKNDTYLGRICHKLMTRNMMKYFILGLYVLVT